METLKRLRSAAVEELLQGHHAGALELYNQVTGLACKEFGANSSYVSNLCFEMGSIALEADKFQQAEEYLSQAVKIKPTSITARVKLAELLLLRGRPDEAKNQAEKALIQQGNNLAARRVLAISYLKTDNPAKATQAFAYLNAIINGHSAPIPRSVTPEPRPTLQEEVKTTTPEPNTPIPREPKPIAAPARLSKPVSQAASVRSIPIVSPKTKSTTQAQTPPASPLPKLKASPPKTFPKPKPAELKAKPTPRGGLVPPPPPTVPIFGGLMVPPPAVAPPTGAGSPGFQLKTKAEVKREPKAKEPPTEEKPTYVESGSEESDFLLDWADKSSKKKRN